MEQPKPRAITQMGGKLMCKLLYSIPRNSFRRIEDTTNPVTARYHQIHVEVAEQRDFPEIPASVWTLKICRDGDGHNWNNIRSVMSPPASLRGDYTQARKLKFTHCLSAEKNGSYTKFSDCKKGWVIPQSDGEGTNRSSHSTATLESSMVDFPETEWLLEIRFRVFTHDNLPAPCQIASLNIMADQFSQLRMNDETSDCILISRDGKSYPAHRAILAARSSVFAAMFQHDLSEKISGQCELKDFDGDVVETLLHYVYTSRVENMGDLVESVFLAAEKYDLQDLRDICQRTMIGTLNAENALHSLNFAKEFCLDALKVKAAKWIGEHAETV